MRRLVRIFSLVLVGSLVISVAPALQAAPARTRLVSKTSSGVPADSWNYTPEVTPNGRFVVFTSESSNLPGASGTHSLVYIHDRKTKKTRLISKTSTGEPANSWSFDASISADGRFVSFDSEATNLPREGGTHSLVYIHDRKTKKTRLISKTSAGTPADATSNDGWISANGRFVAFESEATNLPGGAVHADDMVYLHDTKTKKTRLISKSSAGAPADDTATDPSVSANGRFVAFESNATNLPGGTAHLDGMVYIHDTKTKKTRLISKTSAGAPANADSDDPVLSANGRFVGFESAGTNLPGGAVHANDMVYVHDRKTKKTRLVSKSSAGAPADDDSQDTSISPDGRFVAFESEASNLPGGGAAVSDLVYVHDRKSGKTVLVSRAANGELPDDFAGIPSSQRVLTGGGAYVAFTSGADNLPGGGAPANELVFVRGPLRWPR